MSKLFETVKILHLEPTDVCQAACPLCARETDPEFDSSVRNYLTVEQIKTALPETVITQLDKMFMCGNFGDPAAGHAAEIFSYFKQVNSNITLGMNTNGGLQNADWWSNIASLLSKPKDYVVFSIDGLEDTNHIYRKNVSWERVMHNAAAFISGGGNAQWDMLVYKHNQHQVDECQALAQKMGFKWFRAKVSKRPYINGLEFPVGWQNPVQKAGLINCQALKESSVYMDAKGNIHPCCWLGNRLSKFVTMEEVQATWATNPHPVCKSTCSTVNNSFTNQWQREVQLC